MRISYETSVGFCANGAMHKLQQGPPQLLRLCPAPVTAWLQPDVLGRLRGPRAKRKLKTGCIRRAAWVMSPQRPAGFVALGRVRAQRVESDDQVCAYRCRACSSRAPVAAEFWAHLLSSYGLAGRRRAGMSSRDGPSPYRPCPEAWARKAPITKELSSVEMG